MSGITAAMVGSSSEIISISDASPTQSVATPTNALATYSLESDGDIVYGSGAGTDQGDWVTPKRNFASYEVRATETSGTVSTGTVGSWLALDTTRTWTVTYTSDSPGSKACTLTVEIRKGATTIDAATISMLAEVV